MTKALVVLSGGQDSTTCLFAAIGKYGRENVGALTIDYGQRHARELESAALIAGMSGIEAYKYEVLKVGPILKGTSPLTNSEEVLEQYKDHQSLPGGLEKTFVPARNLLFMTIAANRAYVGDYRWIVLGLSEEDYGGYPDCREPFVHMMSSTVKLGLDKDIGFQTPLMHMSKAKSVHWALSFPGCYHALAYSHTSYDGAYPPTGRDHATLLRAKGFEEAGIPDPLVVRAHLEGVMQLPATAIYQDRFIEIIQGLEGEGVDDKLWDLEKKVKPVV